MSIEIIDTGASVEITGIIVSDKPKEVSFTKDDLSQTIDVDSQLVAISDGRSSHRIDFNDVTTPAGLTSAQDLRDYINSLLPSGGGGGGGDASAANQTTQIGLETTIADNTTAIAAVDFATETTLTQSISKLTEIEDNTSGTNDGVDNLNTLLALGSSAVTSTVNAVLVSTTLISSNSERKSVWITNESDGTLYLKYGTAATTSSYTVPLFKNDVAFIDDYSGVISGIWDVASGSAKVTEVTL